MTIEEADASCVHCAEDRVAAVVCKRIGTHSICDVRFAPQRLTMIISSALTSNDGKEEEHDGVEEAETEGQGILVDHSRDDKDGQHGSCSEFPVGQLQGSGQERRGRGLKSKLRGQRGICASGLTRDRRCKHISRGQIEESRCCLSSGVREKRHIPRESPGSRSKTANRGPPRSRCGNSW